MNTEKYNEQENIDEKLEDGNKLIDIPYLIGGGICIFSGNYIIINDTIIENNKAELYGGGIALFNDINTIKINNTVNLNNTINSNTSSLGDNLFIIGKGEQKATQPNDYQVDLMYIRANQDKNYIVNYFDSFLKLKQEIDNEINKNIYNYMFILMIYIIYQILKI